MFRCGSLPILLVAALVAFLGVTCSGQAPNPPPIWPSQFLGKFGLYLFDGLSPDNHSPIFNETSYFFYNSDVTGQLIQYPDRCTPILPNGDSSPCQILFRSEGIFMNQPGLGIQCCQLIAGVGPTPRNFTRGFTWNGTSTAPDYHGVQHNTDYYVNDDGSFKYWTEIAVPPVTAHHDIFFRDGGGAFWAWETPLSVEPIPPSTFDLFADQATCSMSCGVMLGLSKQEQHEMKQRASKSHMIQLSLHHHRLEQREKAQTRLNQRAKRHPIRQH